MQREQGGLGLYNWWMGIDLDRTVESECCGEMLTFTHTHTQTHSGGLGAGVEKLSRRTENARNCGVAQGHRPSINRPVHEVKG